MTLGALTTFWLSQMRRDWRVITSFAVFGLVPHLLAWRLDRGWAGSAIFLTLVIPLPVAWLWGEEMSAGRLALLVLAGTPVRRIYTACQFAILSVALPLAFFVTFYVPLWQGGLIVAQSVLMVEVGFLFAAVLASADAGWMPLLIAAVGIWTPLIFLVPTTTQGARLPLLIKIVVTLFLPQVALVLRMGTYLWVMITIAIGIVAITALGFTSLRKTAFRRPIR